MTSKFSRWYTAARRYFKASKTVRRPRSSRLRHMQLESRLAPATFAGGVTVASGDINNDGFQDIVTGAGPGGTSLVKIYNGVNGQIMRQFNAFDASFKGGVFVAVGDVNGDGKDDIICGAGQGGRPHIKVIDGTTGGTIFDFLAFSRNFKGGARVAAGDIDGDGRDEIIVGAGPGGTPHVAVFSGATGKNIANLSAFDSAFRGGIYVAAGDLTGDNKMDVIAGAGEGGSPLVSVFNINSGSQGSSIRTFFAYEKNFRGGVRVGAADISTGDFDDIVTATGPGGGPHVKVFNGTTNAVERQLFAYGASFRGGVFVGSNSNFNGFGGEEILTGAGAGGGPHVIAYNGDTLRPLTSFFAYEPNTSPGGFSTLNTDRAAPTITITAPVGTPTQKTNLTVTGKVADNLTGVSTLTVSVDGVTPTNVSFDAAGNFTFNTTFALNGTDDKTHSLSFVARDKANNVSPAVTVSFTLDSTVTAPILSLADQSDTGTKGDLITSNATVTILGTTEANAAVRLVQSGAETKADATGNFRFDNISLSAGVNTFTFQATDALGNTSQGTVSISRNSGPTVSAQIADVTVAKNAPNTVIDLSNNFNDVDLVNTRLRFNTSEGIIDVEMFDRTQPLTVANFLQYIEAGRYNNSIFHRFIENFVLQGGGFTQGPDNTFPTIPTFAPLTVNELGRLNLRGTISMAKPGGSIRVTNQFFFNLVDNPVLDGPNIQGGVDQNSGGFTVFAQVTSGLDVLDRFAEYTSSNQAEFNSEFSNIPLTNYNGTNFPTDTRPSNFATISSVAVTQRSDRLAFTVASNDNTGLVTATVVGNQLTLQYTAGQTGTANITIRATDLDGSTVEQTFKVTVN